MSSFKASFADCIKRTVGPNEHAAPGNGRRSQHACIDLVASKDVRRAPSGKYNGLTVFREKVNLAVTGDRRSAVHTADAFLPYTRPGFRIYDGRHAHISDHVDQAVVLNDG